MSDKKQCDFCGEHFEFHSYSYQPVNLPYFNGRGCSETNDWKNGIIGSHNTQDCDVCATCYKKIVTFLKKLSKQK